MSDDCREQSGACERGRYWLAALAVAMLAACSNGRGSLSEPAAAPVTTEPPPATPPPTTPPPTPPPEPPPAPPPQPPPTPPPEPPPSPPGSGLAGYWKGSVTDTDSRRVSPAVALIDHQGEAQLMVLGENDDDDDDDDNDAQFVLHGNLCCDDGFDDEIVGKRFLNSRNEEANVNVRVASGRLTGDFEFRRRDYTLNLGASSEYGEALTLQSLGGVYTQTTTPLLGAPSTMTLTIDANGQLTGSHTNGCAINGSVSIPNIQRNMVRIDMEMSGCGDSGSSSRQWNGGYDGLGLLLRNAASPGNPSLRQDVFYHSAVGPTWLGPQSVGK